MTLHPEIQKLMSDMWREVQVASQQRAIREAKLNPEKHKLSNIIADHKPASYFYMTATEKSGQRRRRAVRWCWAKHPNIAGYYLSWRQLETPRRIKRTQYRAHKHRYLGELRAQKMIAKASGAATDQRENLPNFGRMGT